jgi:thioredoxin reductase (NADPH)
VVVGAAVIALDGANGKLETVHLRKKNGQEIDKQVGHLFLFIGAEPNTDWLAGSSVTLDGKGFILTGEDAGGRHDLETAQRGVFAIGDVRANSVKRVAAAVGEGAQVVAALHGYLAARSDDPLAPPGVVPAKAATQ